VARLGGQRCRLSRALQESRRAAALDLLHTEIKRRGISDKAMDEIPKRWETVGDVLLLPKQGFSGPEWSWLDESFWSRLAACFGMTRVARYSVVDSSPRRESRIRLLLPALGRPDKTGPGSPGWVRVLENGIAFHFDITRVMFCSGNVTERMRMGRYSLQGCVVADLYCGIGYYSLPFLVHGQVSRQIMFEWNEDSLLALKTNLAAAGVQESRYEIYEGDNRTTAMASHLESVADRVCLGLLPSSEDGWPLAARLLKPSGGVIHVHMNINKKEQKKWTDHVCHRFQDLFVECGKQLRVECVHLEVVKSYAPLVLHVVADLNVVRCKE